jgi:hypothetical protein
MSLQKKIIVGTAVYLVLLLALFVFVNGFPFHRREFDRAYIAWLDNPNPQTESLLHAQSRKTLMIHLENSAAAALVLLFGGFACLPHHRSLASSAWQRSPPNRNAHHIKVMIVRPNLSF